MKLDPRWLLLGLLAMPLWAQTPSGTVELDGAAVPNAAYFRQNGNVFLPLEAIGKAMRVQCSMDPTGRFLTWNGRIIGIHAMTVGGVAYAPWYDLQPLLEGRQLDVHGTTVALNKAVAPTVSAVPGKAPVGDMRGSEIVKEMTLARTTPQDYVRFLEERRKWYVADRIYNPPGQPSRKCKEGIKGLEDAIAFMHAQSPIPALAYSPGMTRACVDFITLAGPAGAYGGTGPDGSTGGQRIARYGQASGAYTEEVEYGWADPRYIVIDMIIDDGDPGRSHRADIFNPAFGVAGAAVGRHSVVDWFCCIEFAGGYQENPPQ